MPRLECPTVSAKSPKSPKHLKPLTPKHPYIPKIPEALHVASDDLKGSGRLVRQGAARLAFTGSKRRLRGFRSGNF